ncbi:hypothetical protein [Adlercreutzia agrestimuris]|uniref:hypothetical protein n=1 Tax=Adlercreutzia agrestimuris TaxID=2941324 RepID=UPI002040F4C5|nr:hypothetical protein [Adlercreutzia agrestimuris]
MAVAIYHRVMRREGFEETAKTLLQLVRDAQKKMPDEPRDLYLDIDDHRNEAGGFDSEMVELQREFVLGFLMPFLNEAHMPLVSVSNPHEQSNEIPDKLVFFNFDENKGNESNELASLYIKNLSNTEFVSEKPVYAYLTQVSDFLVELQSIHPMYSSKNAEGVPEWRFYWHSYLVDLMTELFNGFVLGNLISVSAMTRTLIESYAYIRLFDKDVEGRLVYRWYASALFTVAKKASDQDGAKELELLKEYCDSVGVSYEEMKKDRRKGGDNAWLKPLFGKQRISFRDICDHLVEQDMADDYLRANSFVHAQDASTKTSPFTYFATIYGKLYLMMDYIFKVVNLLIPAEEAMQERIVELREELYMLGEKMVRQ